MYLKKTEKDELKNPEQMANCTEMDLIFKTPDRYFTSD